MPFCTTEGPPSHGCPYTHRPLPAPLPPPPPFQVRIQLRTPAASIFGTLDNMRNELVIRFQPGEAIYVKMVVKKPGLDLDFEVGLVGQAVSQQATAWGGGRG